MSRCPIRTWSPPNSCASSSVVNSIVFPSRLDSCVFSRPSSASLNGLAERLQQLVGQFRI